jgi:serine/threonine protein phosphatase 1
MTEPARTIAIGDIHGCSAALVALLDAISPREDDLIVTLGDYVDRGPDSRGVLDRLIRLGRECRHVPILGNHDEMFLHAIRGSAVTAFLGMGGLATMRSYGAGEPTDFEVVPREHVSFLERCVDYFETATHIFLHACYVPDLAMADQPSLAIRWESIRDGIPEPHFTGKVAVVGHTSQKQGQPLDAGHLRCIDTYCYGGGWLTGLEVLTGRIWQANMERRVRESPGSGR